MKNCRLLALVLSLLLMAAPFASASPTLKNGSNGQNVSLLQKKLQELGYSISVVDGVFGNETKSAVEAFQRDKKIPVTGVVNNSTWRVLRESKPTVSKKTVADTPKKAAKASLIDSQKAKNIIGTAKKYIGTPYVFGGTTPEAFDCSGYVQYVFRENGVIVPRTADEQYAALGNYTKNRRELVPGDLVFFDTDNTGISHVGLYLGKDEFIHASGSKGVRIDALDNAYWKPRYVGGKHIVK